MSDTVTSITYRRLRHYARPYWGLIAIGMLAMLLEASASGAILWLLGTSVSRLKFPVGWSAQGIAAARRDRVRAVRARESAEGERYRFEVVAALPLAGPLVHYRGWLHVE